MKIAFFASSLVSAYWNGAATYYRGIVRGLHCCGHDVTFFEPDAYGRQQHRDIEDPDWATVVVYPGEGTDGVSRALEQAQDADVIVKASGVGVFDELLERLVLQVRRPEALVVFWDVDAPATLDRVHGDPADPFLQLIPQVRRGLHLRRRRSGRRRLRRARRAPVCARLQRVRAVDAFPGAAGSAVRGRPGVSR